MSELAEATPRATARSRLIAAAKAVAAVGVVAYMIHAGMIDLAALKVILGSPMHALIALVLMSIMTLLGAIRWQMILRAHGQQQRLPELFSLTMVGNFFNAFMPGSVGGDVIKGWYIARGVTAKRLVVALTVVVDRAAGLTLYILSTAVMLGLYLRTHEASPEMWRLGWTIWGLAGSIAAIGVLIATRRVPRAAALSRFLLVRRFAELADIYRRKWRYLVAAALLSAGILLGTCTLFKLQGDALGIDLAFRDYLFVVPVGLTVSSIPLLPGGIGVGQVAFFTLFVWLGRSDPAQGSSLCTAMQVYATAFNLLGAFWYARYRPRR